MHGPTNEPKCVTPVNHDHQLSRKALASGELRLNEASIKNQANNQRLALCRSVTGNEIYEISCSADVVTIS